MKSLDNFLTEDQTNEVVGELFSSFDVSLVVLVSSFVSALSSIGIMVTGQTIRQSLSAMHHAKRRVKMGDLLMKLKDLTRSVPDIDDPAVTNVLNDPGEWSYTELRELRRALFDKMTPEQIKEYEKIEKEYLSTRNKLYSM